MLFRQADLAYDPIQEATNILNGAIYLDESESVTSVKAIPVVENNNIGAFVVRFDNMATFAEDHGISYEDAINVIAESNGIDVNDLAVAVKETTIMDSPGIVNELCNVVVTPIPETDCVYQFTEACVDAFIESGDVSYIDLLVEETTKDEKIMDMIHSRAAKYEHRMDDKKSKIDRDLEFNKLDMKNEQSNIKKLLKAVKHYGYNTPKALIQKAIASLRKKYNQILQNIPRDKSQQKWYQKILIVIEKTINKIGQYINFGKKISENPNLTQDNLDTLEYINKKAKAASSSKDPHRIAAANAFADYAIDSMNRRSGARVTVRNDSDFDPFDYYDYD